MIYTYLFANAHEIHSYLERFPNLMFCNAMVFVMIASCMTFVYKSPRALTRFYDDLMVSKIPPR